MWIYYTLSQKSWNRKRRQVYYTPDPSQNISLYMMDQLGNTDISLGGTFKDKVNFLKGKGLQYIMIGNTDS
jgi:hypothetical protein